MKYVAINAKGQVLTPRRATGRVYEARASWSNDGEAAKVFSTKSAAVNSARQTGEHDFKVYNVFLRVGDEA